MEHKIIIPQFDEENSIITVSKWYKNAGDGIFKGEIIAEVESDVATCEIISPQSGILDVIFIPQGKTTYIGAQIATILSDSSNFSDKSITNKSTNEIYEELINAHRPNINTIGINKEEKHREEQAIELANTIANERPETDANNWNTVESIPSPDDVTEDIDEVKHIMLQKRKSDLEKSLMLTITNEVDMSAIIKAGELFGDKFKEKHEIRLGFTPFIIKVIINALKEYPMFNSYVLDNKFVLKNNYDIAVVTGGKDSIPCPVIRNADAKSILELERSMIILSERAKNGEITLEESSGATFTLVNAGIYGSLFGSDVITYPQITTFTMHKVKERPVAIDKQVLIRPMMYISMSFDHRIANSMLASSFMEKIKTYIEDISWMILDI